MTQSKAGSSSGTQSKEWDEIACPVCLDQPHNAVLLVCASHDKGCRPMVCDTSHRHSNCLDRLKTQKPGDPVTCPLCRGPVIGFRIEEELRHYLDQKPRACSRESCAFSGCYRELRRHARRAHPAARPAAADPSRQRAWRRLERERELGDVISALHAASPGAVVIGDYVIDGANDDVDDAGPPRRSWWTTLFMLQMLQSPPPARSWRSHRRPGHRALWDLNLPDLDDAADDAARPPRRRRFSRPSPERDDSGRR
ncbi:cellulose synthase, putative (DUF1644) [Wolffia australiana]